MFFARNTIWNVETVDSSERSSMIVSICAGSFLVDAATYACSILWVLESLPVALSLIMVHAVPSKRKAIPKVRDFTSASIGIHRKYGTNAKKIASGCIRHIAQAVLTLAPIVDVNMPIRKLAKRNIPSVM